MLLDARERKRYIKAAKELIYPEEVIKKLEEAETEEQCDRIMRDARNNTRRWDE